MKKIITFIIVSFLFIGSTSALTSDEQLTNLQNNIKLLQEKVEEVENSRLDKTYPVGSIYITTSYSTASQVKSAIGGTWEAYGSGRTLIGVNANDTNFNTVNKTGGSSTTTLTSSNLPGHTHSIPSLSGTAASAGSHTHSIPALSGSTNSAGAHNHSLRYADNQGTLSQWGISWKSSTTSRVQGGDAVTTDGAHTHTVTTTASNTGSAGAHTHAVTTTASNTGRIGSGTAFTNLQPYITVYMYKRVS